MAIFNLVRGFFMIIAALILEAAAFSVVFYLAWNISIPRLFNLPEITIIDGGTMIFICRVLSFSMQRWMSNAQSLPQLPTKQTEHDGKEN